MTDWATRVSTPENPLREMQSPAPSVDVDDTIAAIRRLIEEQAHLLPADVVATEARRQAAREEPVVAEGPDAFQLVVADQQTSSASRGVFGLLRSLRR